MLAYQDGDGNPDEGAENASSQRATRLPQLFLGNDQRGYRRPNRLGKPDRERQCPRPRRRTRAADDKRSKAETFHIHDSFAQACRIADGQSRLAVPLCLDHGLI